MSLNAKTDSNKIIDYVTKALSLAQGTNSVYSKPVPTDGIYMIMLNCTAGYSSGTALRLVFMGTGIFQEEASNRTGYIGHTSVGLYELKAGEAIDLQIYANLAVDITLSVRVMKIA